MDQSLLGKQDVLLDLDCQDRQGMFEAVGRYCQEQRGIAADTVVKSLAARETLGSTGLGQGVAVPHARVSGLTEPVTLFVRPKTPIAFGAPDGNPVQSFFFLLAPLDANERHLQILADVAEQLSGSQFRTQLGVSTSKEEICHLFPTRGAGAGAGVRA
ncbi:MAG: PTS sugar transporter subunit IIA [Burkholderiaceae bacterium]|nr:PTS sugar transporter subunit IIA [Burkholderiaceae bacterium]